MTITGIAIGQTSADAEFQEKMRERLKHSIGDLLPDEALKDIIAKGIHEAFFKPQAYKGTSSYYADRDKEYPSWLLQYLRAECDKQVQAAVQQWIIDNPDKIAEVLKNVMQDNLLNSVFSAFNNRTQETFNELRTNLVGVMNNIR